MVNTNKVQIQDKTLKLTFYVKIMLQDNASR